MMSTLKVSDGIRGQIALFVLFLINKMFPLNIDYYKPSVYHFLFSVQQVVDFIMRPVDMFVDASVLITKSPLLGIGGFILGIIVIGFIYGIILGAIMRSFAKIIRALKSKSSP